MAKVTVVPLGSMENQTTFVQTLNANFEAVAAALETLLSRDGTSPNQMTASLDMNSERIINLPSPLSATEPARLTDLTDAQALAAAVIPSMTGNDGKVLSNDGTVLTWNGAADLPDFGDLQSALNLSDVASASTSRTTLGLGTAAVKNISTSGNNVPVLDAANTWSGAQTFSGTSAFSGATTFSGSGDHRLTSTPTALTPESIGFRGSPVASQDTNYTFILTDAGKTKLHTSGTGHTYTIPPTSSVAFPTGTVFIVANTGAGDVVVTRGSGVSLRKSGSATDANITLAQWGIASILKIGADTWVISGTNIS